MSVKQACHDINYSAIFNDSCVHFKDNMMGGGLLRALSGVVYLICVGSGHIAANVAMRESRDFWHQHLRWCAFPFLFLLGAKLYSAKLSI